MYNTLVFAPPLAVRPVSLAMHHLAVAILAVSLLLAPPLAVVGSPLLAVASPPPPPSLFLVLVEQTMRALLNDEANVVQAASKELFLEKPFMCLNCYFKVNAKTVPIWNNHVFKALKPYSCALVDYSSTNMLYDC